MTPEHRKQLNDLVDKYGVDELSVQMAAYLEDAFKCLSSGPLYDRAMQNVMTLRNTANIIHKN
jgi:hypothetical protein